MKFALKTALLTTTLSVATLAQANFVEGQDYKALPNPETIAGDVIVVREFFWYGCPHCYHLEPHMQKWAKTRPADVAFFQTPAAMNPVWEVGARGFYAAQQLDAQEKPIKHYLMPSTKMAIAILSAHNKSLVTGTPLKASIRPNLTACIILLP